MLAWHSKDTFFRETHVGMLTQHEVFLQAGVQVWVFNKALILIRIQRIIRKVFQASENTNQDLAGGRD